MNYTDTDIYQKEITEQHKKTRRKYLYASGI